MDDTEFSKSANDFPSLFGSNGLFKNKLKEFNKNQEEFKSLNEKVEEVKEESSKLKNEANVWIQRKSQFKLAKDSIEDTYLSEVPPKDQEGNKYYQERYTIIQEFISVWSACLDDVQDCQKKCDELERFFEESIQRNKNDMNKILDQLSKLSLSGGRFYSYFFKYFKPSTCRTKSRGCFNFGFFSKYKKMIQVENLFIEVGNILGRYQDDVTSTEDKIGEYREFLDKTILQINRTRMCRTPAYSKQVQQCSVCSKPYAFIKWCKFCDREQFRKQFSNWETGHSEFDEIIRDSQLSIKYPNGYIQWIPYEKFTNIEFVGKGAFAKVYRADWTEGLSVWDCALGKRIQYPNTPVALKELRNSVNISKEFREEVVAYIKSSSSTVLRCYGISRNPISKEYIMVFPYAYGGNLRNYMKKRLNWVNRLDVLRHILYGLADIHIRGLVHRDLHPGNLLHYRRTIAVSDLGLCRPVDGMNESERIFGVMPFVAPEVLEGEPYTEASDVYSIGIIMWFLTSGQYPFSDRKYDQFLAGEICEKSHPLRPNVLEGTPPDYEKLMRECWDADPNKRPTTKELYQKIISWLYEFNKKPLPDTTQQFLTSKLEEPEETYTLSNDQLASRSIVINAIKEYRLEDNKVIETNPDNDDEDDQWNTIHVNDYQNWLHQFDIMGDYSEGKIASIVTNNLLPQLEFKELLPSEKIRIAEKRRATRDEEKKLTTINQSVLVSDVIEKFTE